MTNRKRGSKKPLMLFGDTQKQSGSVTSEYLVVTAGLLIVWVGIDIALDLIVQHNTNYSATLELLF